MSAHAYNNNQNSWPELPLEAWQDTYDTLHMWTQIVGKVRLALSLVSITGGKLRCMSTPAASPLQGFLTATGSSKFSSTSSNTKLTIQTSWNSSKTLPLKPQSVADFYAEFMSALHSLGIQVKIWTMPVEVPTPVRFETDTQRASYDPEYAHRFWQVLILCETVFAEFRSRFIGKDSPVHFFWGSFDLCVTRFSGRRAPERVGADPVTREAYSHEVISAGFWPGGGEIKGPAFYAYAAPEPAGFAEQPAQPPAAFYHPQLHEFLLMYDDVRQSDSPRAALLSSCKALTRRQLTSRTGIARNSNDFEI